MADNDSVQVSTGQKVRTIRVTKMIAGVATDVEMEVVAIADSAGNVIDNFVDYDLQREQLLELRRIRQTLWEMHGTPVFGVPVEPYGGE
jgi:hypothetical protein